MTGKSKKTSTENPAATILAAIAREQKAAPKAGRAGSQSGGYEYDSGADEHGFYLVVYGFDHKDKAFRSSDEVYVIIRASKPEPRHGKAQEVKAVRRILGFRAFRVANPRMIQEKSVVAFCRRHASRLRQLQLRGPEDIGITSDSVRFRWVSADPVLLKPRLVAFVRLIHEMAGTPAPAVNPILFQREWRLKPAPKFSAPKSVAAHRFGGNLGCMVGCPECNEATTLIVQLDLTDPCLPKTAMGRIKLPVFSCLACLDSGPAFYDLSGAQPRVLRADGRALKPKKLPDNEEELSPRSLALSLVPKGGRTGLISKVGGTPAWVQTAETPSCPKCNKRMSFVMQMASSSEVMFGDAGLLYTFVCPKCKVVASLIQSY